jgi:hypothetical protein
MKKIEAGDVISCPKCNLLIGKFEVDVEAGSVLHSDMITPYIDDLATRPMNCPKCQTPFFDTERLMIHLSRKGWF